MQATMEGEVHLNQLEFAVIDTETTGRQPTSHLVEFACEVISSDGVVCSRYETLVRPPGPLGASIIHRIDESMLIDAPSFRSVASSVLEMLVGRVVVAHNLAFDWSVLRSAFRDLDVRLPTVPRGICTARASRRVVGPPVDLRRLCHRLSITTSDLHTAAGDVRATSRVFLWLIDSAPSALPAYRPLLDPGSEGRLPSSSPPHPRDCQRPASGPSSGTTSTVEPPLHQAQE